MQIYNNDLLEIALYVGSRNFEEESQEPSTLSFASYPW